MHLCLPSPGAANAAGLPTCATDQVPRLYTLYGTSTLAAAQSSPSIVVGGLALDSPRRRLLFAEQLVQSPGPFSYVRSVNLTTGSFGVFAGRSGASSIGYAGASAEGALATNTSLGTVAAIAVNETSGDVFIAEPSIRRVRRINATNGRIYTVAGTGVDGCPTAGQLAVSAPLSNPQGLLVEHATGRLLISLGAGCNQVVAVAPNGTIELFAGRLNAAGAYDGDGGASTAAGIAEPAGLAAIRDPLSGGPAVLLADTGAHVIRGVTIGDATIRSFIGQGSVAGYSGDGSAAALTSLLSRPTDMAVTPDGDVLFADAGNYVLRALLANGSVTLLAGQPGAGADVTSNTDNMAAGSAVLGPSRIAYDALAKALYFSDTRASAIRLLRCVPTASSNGTRFSLLTGFWIGCTEVSTKACGLVPALQLNAFVSPSLPW